VGPDERPDVDQVYGRNYQPELHDPTAKSVGGRGMWLLIALSIVVLIAVGVAKALLAPVLDSAEEGYDGHEDAYRPKARPAGP
jgi:hypothetical protein